MRSVFEAAFRVTFEDTLSGNQRRPDERVVKAPQFSGVSCLGLFVPACFPLTSVMSQLNVTGVKSAQDTSSQPPRRLTAASFPNNISHRRVSRRRRQRAWVSSAQRYSYSTVIDHNAMQPQDVLSKWTFSLPDCVSQCWRVDWASESQKCSRFERLSRFPLHAPAGEPTDWSSRHFTSERDGFSFTWLTFDWPSKHISVFLLFCLLACI